MKFFGRSKKNPCRFYHGSQQTDKITVIFDVQDVFETWLESKITESI